MWIFPVSDAWLNDVAFMYDGKLDYSTVKRLSKLQFRSKMIHWYYYMRLEMALSFGYCSTVIRPQCCLCQFLNNILTNSWFTILSSYWHIWFDFAHIMQPWQIATCQYSWTTEPAAFFSKHAMTSDMFKRLCKVDFKHIFKARLMSIYI